MPGTWNPQWDARKPLKGAPPALGRQVGVLISQPFHHVGLNATYVDVNRETPRLNTDTWGNCYPAGETEQHARLAFEKTLAELDDMIAHLSAHRDRLAADLASLPDREFAQNPAPRDITPSAPTKPRPPAVVDVPLPAPEPRVWRHRGTGYEPDPGNGVRVRDCHGDIWTPRDRGPGDRVWESLETAPFRWDYVLKKWGPLTEVLPDAS